MWDTNIFLFLLPSCKSLSGKGRGSIQHITSIYLGVRSAGWSAEQADHADVCVSFCICVGHKTKGNATCIKKYCRFTLSPCKHDWIGPSTQHMVEKSVWLDISPQIIWRHRHGLQSWNKQCRFKEVSGMWEGVWLCVPKKYFNTSKRHINTYTFFLKRSWTL